VRLCRGGAGKGLRRFMSMLLAFGVLSGTVVGADIAAGGSALADVKPVLYGTA
jgi:hypothetical protein